MPVVDFQLNTVHVRNHPPHLRRRRTTTIMDMSMGGMQHMDHPGMGSEINHAFSRDYWYIVAGVVGLLASIRAINAYSAHTR